VPPVPPPEPEPPPTPPTQPATTRATCKLMWVTAYTSRVGALGSSGQGVGPNSVAVADTLWRKKPGTGRGEGEYRINPPGWKPPRPGARPPAQPAYPYGSAVKVYNAAWSVIYEGTVKDTGRGWIRNGFPSDEWIDIWFPNTSQAIGFGKQHLMVSVTPPGE